LKTKFYFLLFLTSLALGEIASYSQGYILYCRGKTNDQGFVDTLRYFGYNVQVKTGGWDGVWDPGDPRLDSANNAALIIISRTLPTAAHGGDLTLASQWNELEPPMISFNPWMSRSNRWQWFNTETIAGCNDTLHWKVVAGEEDNPAFTNVEIGDNNIINIFDTIAGDGIGTIDGGWATVMATDSAETAIVLARWEAFDNFYDGTDQYAGNTRVFFGVSAHDCPESDNDNFYNLNEVGLTILLNLVAEFIPLGLDIEENTLRSNSLSLFPNPVRNILRVDYRSDYAGPAVLSMTDMTGKIVHRETINLVQGANNRYVNVSRFAKGVYTLSLDYENKQVVTKVMVK
jgi:hypothetical protein